MIPKIKLKSVDIVENRSWVIKKKKENFQSISIGFSNSKNFEFVPPENR